MSTSTLCLDVMPMFMLINDISVYLHALNLLFVLYYHHVYERGRSSENMISSRGFNHKKFSSYFCSVLLLVLSPKTLFSLFPLVLLILRAVGA
jgi:hypothetical protein